MSPKQKLLEDLQAEALQPNEAFRVWRTRENILLTRILNLENRAAGLLADNKAITTRLAEIERHLSARPPASVLRPPFPKAA